jgi:predicted aconitase
LCLYNFARILVKIAEIARQSLLTNIPLARFSGISYSKINHLKRVNFRTDTRNHNHFAAHLNLNKNSQLAQVVCIKF